MVVQSRTWRGWCAPRGRSLPKHNTHNLSGLENLVGDDFCPLFFFFLVLGSQDECPFLLVVVVFFKSKGRDFCRSVNRKEYYPSSAEEWLYSAFPHAIPGITNCCPL